MEDGKIVGSKEDKHDTILTNLYTDLPSRVTSNGHDFSTESTDTRDDHVIQNYELSHEDKFRKKVNPLKIHLGKRPFVDNSISHQNTVKRKVSLPSRLIDDKYVTKTPLPRVVPRLIPKKIYRSQFHNVSSHSTNNAADSEEGKPVPRLVPKSQLLQYKKSKAEKNPQLKEYTQYLGLQPMVKFKCRKCCSMFKTLALLREHQLICRAQVREPTLSPEITQNSESNCSGPSRVTRKVYLCSACGTYYENWNLFLHMREVHNRHICLFCLGMFSKAEKLSAHLINKHSVKEHSYNSKEDFFNEYSGTIYLMCCSCDEICSEQDDFFNHDCNNVKPKPVPMLVSKNAAKANNIKQINKNNNEITTNGPIEIKKDIQQTIEAPKISLQTDLNENKNELSTSIPVKPQTVTDIDASISSENITNMSNFSCNLPETKLNCSETSSNHNLVTENKISFIQEKDLLPNGEETLQAEDSMPMNIDSPEIPNVTKVEQIGPLEKEKDCGIKLKLSLNSASSPVIINSTVDPTIGRQNLNKPPSRVRRPPKRYEKDALTDVYTTPFTPTIKMKICDKADSPFVKTTIIENKQEHTTKFLTNNNFDSTYKVSDKSENIIKSTIYDNKPEEINTLNRVPKLTVRVPKELLDRDSSSDYSSDSDVGHKLTVDEKDILNEPIDQKEDLQLESQQGQQQQPIEDYKEEASVSVAVEEKNIKAEEIMEGPKTEETALENDVEMKNSVTEPNTTEKTEDSNVTDDIPIIELTLDRPLDKYSQKDLLKVFLSSTVHNCIYCNHVRKIAVNCEQLSLHMVAQHRFTATVDSITAEELLPETITSKVKVGSEEVCDVFINLDSYDSVDKCDEVPYDQIFECFQCYFKTPIHKDLYLHNRKMHQKTMLLCIMCKINFYSYSELLCHLCPGTYDPEYEIKFRCYQCNIDSIPSSFRLMVHLRKIHHTCDVCLEFCQNQSKLSNHVWKHKLHHLCYRCGIAYRNKPDITKHLFWKHGTESVMCKKCLQKKWPHVYHFCIPPATFICDECSLTFSKAVYLKVHKRLHSEEFPHICQEDGCVEKFVSKKLLMKHIENHKNPIVEESKEQNITIDESIKVESKDVIPVIDLVDEKPNESESATDKSPNEPEQSSKKSKKKKLKDKDLLLDVNLPALNLSESDSSDESDSGQLAPAIKNETDEVKLEQNPTEETYDKVKPVENLNAETSFTTITDAIKPDIINEEKPNEQQVLDIWDNFKKYQAKVEKQKTPPLVPIRKHVCESDHDYCLVPTEFNGENDTSTSKKSKKKSQKKKHGDLTSSSSSSSDSDSSCSCGSNCSCSSSSGSSSSTSTDSDSSDSGQEVKKKKQLKKSLTKRRTSCGSQISAVDVMGIAETPILIPEKLEPPIAESDLETNESETDEEFYDECPQRLANKLLAEKRNQLLLLASVAPSDNGSMSGDISRSATPVKEEGPPKEEEQKVKEEPVKQEFAKKGRSSSSKKKSKKKKKSKSKKPIKINIPKEIIAKSDPIVPVVSPLIPNKITISLQSNTVQIPETHVPLTTIPNASTPMSAAESKRASKRRRVPNKFYGYSSDEETPQQIALKPQLPPKLEWRKEDLPSPVTHKARKEVPSSTITQRLYNYNEPIRLVAPIPDPEPPKILMNTESLESSESDSSDEGALEIYQPNVSQNPIPVPPPHLNSGTSSLPYPFQRPPVRQAREGESVYCYCRCPYDEVSEMIGCDAEGCTIEWFHFECVGIMVPPKGKWYCPECRKKQSYSAYR